MTIESIKVMKMNPKRVQVKRRTELWMISVSILILIYLVFTLSRSRNVPISLLSHSILYLNAEYVADA
jgi:uncharacterized integral membrane protein